MNTISMIIEQALNEEPASMENTLHDLMLEKIRVHLEEKREQVLESIYNGDGDDDEDEEFEDDDEEFEDEDGEEDFEEDDSEEVEDEDDEDTQ